MISVISCRGIGLALLSFSASSDAWVGSKQSSPLFRCSHNRADSGIPPLSKALAMSSAVDESSLSHKREATSVDKELYKLQGKLLKRLRQASKNYRMLEDGDKIMVCMSGGKDSATLLYLVRKLREHLRLKFDIIAVHIDQRQPGYDGTPLIRWMGEEFPEIPYHHMEEDTYSIVLKKTPEDKSFCTACSRLRRGILYTKAVELGCNKIALGHHADDAIETLILNMIHGGKARGMPARYTSTRGSLGVLRPLIYCFEADIARYAAMKQFPILPCNLCKNQPDLHRPQIKLLLSALEQVSVNAKQNILNAMGNVSPSYLLDQELRKMCGIDPVTGSHLVDDEDEPI